MMRIHWDTIVVRVIRAILAAIAIVTLATGPAPTVVALGANHTSFIAVGNMEVLVT